MNSFGRAFAEIVTLVALGLYACMGCAASVPATVRAESARAADAFVDSIGVNVHLHDGGDSVYNARYAAFAPLLEATGIRHLRDGLIDTTYQAYYDHLNELGRAGIHATLITSVGQSVALLRAYPTRVPYAIEAYEGPNEYDARHDPNWVTHLRAFTQLLYHAVKDDSQTAKYPVLGPSLISAQSAAALGDLSAWMDFGNIHDYFAGFNPGTPGWGSAAFGTRYGSIAYNLALEARVSGKKPVIATETGYCTADAKNDVPPVVQGRYVPRLFFEQFNAGIVKTFEYEFADDGGNGGFSSCGLIGFDLKPKPAYYALSALIHLLSDPGQAFTPAPLTYVIAGASADVDHTLLQKRDGTYYLALWRELPSWDVNAGVPITVAPEEVSLMVPAGVREASLFALNDDGTMLARPLEFKENLARVTVTDRVSIVALKPLTPPVKASGP
ncbi:MAG TPA: hypothetical protein VME66_08915 [Candidatus Acidoferrales bacterium]|nr:hypothetical protein [Candidatus Acidoferrales bacterium]